MITIYPVPRSGQLSPADERVMEDSVANNLDLLLALLESVITHTHTQARAPGGGTAHSGKAEALTTATKKQWTRMHVKHLTQS